MNRDDHNLHKYISYFPTKHAMFILTHISLDIWKNNYLLRKEKVWTWYTQIKSVTRNDNAKIVRHSSETINAVKMCSNLLPSPLFEFLSELRRDVRTWKDDPSSLSEREAEKENFVRLTV